MTNDDLADFIDGQLNTIDPLTLQPHLWQQIIAALRRSCPYIVTGKEGTSYCSLAERQPSSDKVLVPYNIVTALADALCDFENQTPNYSATDAAIKAFHKWEDDNLTAAEAEGHHE